MSASEAFRQCQSNDIFDRALTTKGPITAFWKIKRVIGFTENQPGAAVQRAYALGLVTQSAKSNVGL
jgi:hypothetical protein